MLSNCNILCKLFRKATGWKVEVQPGPGAITFYDTEGVQVEIISTEGRGYVIIIFYSFQELDMENRWS